MVGKLRERFGAVDESKGVRIPLINSPQGATKRFPNTCFVIPYKSISESCALFELGNPQNLQKLGRHLVGKATVF